MPRSLAALTLLLVLAAAAPAAAQTATAPGQEPAQQPAEPARAKLVISHRDVGRDGAVLARHAFRIAGRLTPAAGGERVTVRLSSRGERLRSRTVDVVGGRFEARFRVRTAARLVARAVHEGTPALGRARSNAVRVDTLPRRVAPGQRGLVVRLMQRKLALKGYVVGRRGTFDARTARAVHAFRKVSAMRRTSRANRAFMSRLSNDGGTYRLKYPRARGRHVEADLSRVLVLANGSRIERIYPTSSGSTATPTVRGRYRFYLAQPGLNNKEMYYSKYFIRGYAIHGYTSVPPYPASHGCLRVPMPDARSIYDWIRLGDRIDVYA